MSKVVTNVEHQVEWKLPEGVQEFTEDHVYHAYRTGVTEGMMKDEKLFQKQIRDNSALAASDTFSVIEYLSKRGIKALSAHMRIDSRYSIGVLITVSSEDFAKDDFSTVYKYVNQLREKSKTDLYSVTFTFINKTDSFDLESVNSDGFVASFAALDKNK